ncbi:MAG: flagellin [Bryobacteraceae bacterium]|jgi:flagellin
MISFVTNYASMVAENNLNTNNNFQTSTIEALTSGYRINSSGDDPAGLAVANQYRDEVAQVTQGVQNANDGVSTLQIIDGGLNNIGTMLDRLQTLATESATTTFTGDRNNINVEYQQLVQQISQQAATIGLNTGGTFNTQNEIFIGGGNSLTNSQVEVDLSGTANAVDSTALGLTNTTVAAGGAELTGNSVRLDAPDAVFLSGSATQTFTFNLVSNNSATTFTATVNGGATGLSEANVLSSLNSQLSTYGITAQVGGDGQIQFGGGTPFTVSTATTDITDQIATTGSTATNVGIYNLAGLATYGAKAENLTFQNGQGTANVALPAGDSLGSAIAAINAQTSSIGIYAVVNAAGTGISFQSANSFTASTDTAGGAFTAAGAQTVTAPSSTASTTGNALAAVTAIQTALSQLGQVQASVGAGENKLQYAIDLANSQITNVTSAESDIRDADVATEAANLTQAQVLEQASVAAMAQANATPQAILKLLQ